MPTFPVLVEYAIACDLVIEVDAPSADEAIEAADERANDAALWDAIRSQFPGAEPRIVGGDVAITDVRLAEAARAG